MPRLAFLTYAARPALTDDDTIAARLLEARGVRVDAMPWDAPFDVEDYDALVLRSCWDYFEHPTKFFDWVDAVERSSTRLLNPPALVRWNARKTYLADLEARGVAVVPTEWARPGDARTLASVLAGRGWAEAVVKPVVSAGGFETWRTSAREAAAHEARFAALRERADGVMVQPFMREIERGGEWSLLFFGGRFSHSVRKRPVAGDFRVQFQYGGTSTAEVAPPAVLDDARRVIEAIPVAGTPPYARVDGVEVDGRLLLMELEVIEPSLFFAQDEGAAERFVEALRKAMNGGKREVGSGKR